MTSLTKTKLIAYLAAIFVAGALSGGVIGWRKARGKTTLPPPSMEKVCRSAEARLKETLELTQEQVEATQHLFDQAAEKIKKAHKKSLWEIDMALCWRSDEMMPFLDPGQAAKLEAFEMERRRPKESTPKDSPGKDKDPKAR